MCTYIIRKLLTSENPSWLKFCYHVFLSWWPLLGLLHTHRNRFLNFFDDSTQGLLHTRQALYHCAVSPAPSTIFLILQTSTENFSLEVLAHNSANWICTVSRGHVYHQNWLTNVGNNGLLATFLIILLCLIVLSLFFPSCLIFFY